MVDDDGERTENGRSIERYINASVKVECHVCLLRHLPHGEVEQSFVLDTKPAAQVKWV